MLIRSLKTFALGALVASVPLAASAQTVGFTTLQPGAINHIQAQIIGKLVQEKTDLQVRVIPVAGTTATQAAVQNRSAEITIGDVNNLSDAVHGVDMFEKMKPMKDLRAIIKLTNFPIGIMVRKDSGMKTLADLKGKKYPIGWQAFPNGIPLGLGVLASAGMDLNDVNGVNVSGLIPAANDFESGKLDSTLIALPAPAVRKADAAVGGIRWLEMPTGPEAEARVKKIKPEYGIMMVPPGPANVGVEKPTPFLQIHNLLISATWVDDDIVYKFVKTLLENKEELIKGHPMYNGFFTDERAAPQFKTVEYHPGAIKAFKEKGIWQGS